MINRNQADYTNFDGKTNRRIVQAPGGSSSISLGWQTNNNNDYSKVSRGYGHTSQNQGVRDNNYAKKNSDNQAYQRNQEQSNNLYNKKPYNQNNNKFQEEKSSRNQNKDSMGSLIGGEYGYNNYTNETTGNNNYSDKNHQNTYSQQYPPKNLNSRQREQKVDPVSFYKPSSSSGYKNQKRQQLDLALQEQRHKVQNSKGYRNPNQPSYGTSNQRSNSQINQRPCVKIKAQQQNSIFGNEYNYWKQDSHNTDKNSQGGSNKKSDNPYMHQKVQQSSPYSNENGHHEKTSVRVHNPPGGRSNFTFG